MRLYATVQSERASKGQGGQWLKIIIRNEYQHCIAYINVRSKNKIDIDVLSDIQLDIQRPIQICTDDDTKYEKQKLKNKIDKQIAFLEMAHQTYLKKQKGKKQKGKKLHICETTGAILKHCPRCGRK